MSKPLKRNLIDIGIVGIAALYGLFITYFKTDLYWEYATDGILVLIQNFLYGLSIFSLASLLFRSFGKRIKSNTWAKLISFVLSVILVYGYQILMIFILALGTYGLDLTGYLEFQFLPDFQTYAYILTMNTAGIPAKLAWIFAYWAVWLKYYFAALFFFVFVRAKKPDMQVMDSTENQSSEETQKPLPSFCPHCGAPVTTTGGFCLVCGKPLIAGTKVSYAQPIRIYPPVLPDNPSIGFNVLAFFVPVVGLILFAVWSTQFPKKSKAVGKWALVGFITETVAMVAFYLVFFTVNYSMMMQQN
jgi:hypothetical protein